MSKTRFQVEILTPEGSVFDDEVEMISTRTSVGSIGVLANHTPILAMLDPCELRLHRSEGEVLRFAQGEGYMQVGGNRAMLLLEDAVPAAELNAAELKAKLDESRAQLQEAEQDSEKQRAAQRDVRRLEAFLLVAEAS